MLYHFVCPTKYRRAIPLAGLERVDTALLSICAEIANRYEIEFLEIGVDGEQMHFLVQSVPTYSPLQIIRILKRLTERELFLRIPELKTDLWGGKFWGDDFTVNTVESDEWEREIRRYVEQQGIQDYQRLWRS